MRWFLLLLVLCSFVAAQPIKVCDGCFFDGKCIGYKSQIKLPMGIVYCAEDSKLYPVKADTAACSESYECLSFFCDNGVCQSAVVPEPSKPSFMVVYISFAVVLVAFLLFFLVRSSKAKKDVRSKSSGPVQQQPANVKLLPVKRKYSPFDIMDKKIDESSKRVGKP